jgi:putative NADH-flavin reductase
MRIAVLGASGWLGGTIARQALERGHEVTAIARDAAKLSDVEAAGAAVATADVRDPASVQRAVAGSDVVVSAVTDRTTPDRSIIPLTARTLLDVLPAAGVRRLAVVGGGGSLEVEPGVRAVDRPGFPEEYKPEALAQAEALDVLRSSDTPVDWTYISPPVEDLAPGEPTGRYRVQGGNAPVVDSDGHSRIDSGDLAAALLDEVEHPRFTRQRFTAGY